MYTFQLYFNWRFVQNIKKSLFEETGNDVNLKEYLLYVGNCVSLYKVVFFICSAQISVLKRKTVLNQRGSFVMERKEMNTYWNWENDCRILLSTDVVQRL